MVKEIKAVWDEIRRVSYLLGLGLVGLWLRFVEGANLTEANRRLRVQLRTSLEINKELVEDWYRVKQQNETLREKLDLYTGTTE